MRSLFSFVLLSCLALSIGRAEVVGRIDSAGDKTLRCANREVTDAECKERRDKARARNCVTVPEYRLLVRHNLCPSCDWERTGLDAYDGWCPPGCFARGTQILVKDLSDGATKWVAIEVIAANIKSFEIWSVDEGATVARPTFSSHQIRRAVVGPEELPMVNVQMEDGNKISVTSGHAMLLASGVMVLAEALKAGDSLLTHEGHPVTISAVERELISDDVFNLLLDVDSPISHTIIAANMITGDQYWQGELQPLLGTVIMKP